MLWTPFRFVPLFKERPWGGSSLEGWGGRHLPPGAPIGESWEVVDRKEEQSIVATGPFTGRALSRLLREHPNELLGDGYPGGSFPLLIKLLDCRERLSLQVHPPASVAPRLGGETKTEAWFILRADPEAYLMLGLRRGATREAFERARTEGALEPLLHTIPVKAGDYVFVPAGRLHAIGAGIVLLEVQESSDTTYRVYDWGRPGLDGQPRRLHAREALESIDFEDVEPHGQSFRDRVGPLVSCPAFGVSVEKIEPGQALELPRFRMIYVLSGTGHLAGAEIHPGELWFLPAALERAVLEGTESLSVLVIERPLSA